jgi:tripartite ATP-independent transporter DctM subunit
MAFVFAIVGAGGIALLKGINVLVTSLQFYPFTQSVSFELATIPLFILMGLLLFEVGVGDEIFRAIRAWVGHISGGLAASVTVSAAVMGTITGSSSAAVAVLAKIAYPEMRKFRYDQELAFGVTACTSTLACLIPPSVTLVYLAMLAEESIGKVLIAGFLPGVLSAMVYIGMIVIRCRLNPRLGPPSPRASWRERFTTLRYLLPAVSMLVIIIVGIYKGVFTASEAAGAGTVVALVTVLARKSLSWRVVKASVLETCRLTLMIMVLIVSIKFFTQFMVYSGVSQIFTQWAVGVPNRFVTLLFMFIVYFVLGAIIGPIGMAMLTIPVFAPVVKEMGFSMIWFLICVQKMVEVGLITPPVCTNIYIAQAVVKDTPTLMAVRSTFWFLICDFCTLILYVLFPQIILYLPERMAG